MSVMSKTFLITGCNRGLGLEMVRQLLRSSSNNRVIATARQPQRSEALQQMQRQYDKNLLIVPMDVTSDKSIKEARDYIAKSGSFDTIDVLVNNAGVMTPWDEHVGNSTRSDLMGTFDTNVAGPMFVTQQFAHLLVRSKRTDRAIVMISSGMGSISRTTQDSSSSYRISKAALNMLTKCLSVHEFPEKQCITTIALSPGWVETDMGLAGGGSPPQTVEEAVSDMLHVINGITPDSNGKFFNYDGKEIEW